MRRLLLLAAAVVLVDTMFYAAVTPLLPRYTDELGSRRRAGVLTASYAAGTLLGSFPGGWLAARFGAKPAVITGLVLLSVSGLVSDSPSRSPCSTGRGSCRESGVRSAGQGRSAG